MSKKFKPFLAHSEITDCIYIIDGNDKYEVTEQCIKAMKATNRMPGWIPVSERLPEEDGWYLVTVKNLTGYTLLDREVFECRYFGDWIFEAWEDNHVIAWMPLPHPYKSEIPTGTEESDKE